MNYDCRPPRRNYGAHLIVVTLLACAGVSFLLSGRLPRPILWQVLGLVFVLPAIQLTARYIASRYLYRLRMDEGETVLEIFVYRGGTKMQLVCCVGMEEITDIAPLSQKNARAAKGLKRYNYAQDVCPREGLVLSLSNRDGECEVLFCPDAGLARLLRERIPKKEA